MATSGEFNAAAVMLIQASGGPAVYRQAGLEKDLRVLVDTHLEIMDEMTGAGQIVKGAMFTNAEFPFDAIKNGDTITQDGTTWTVLRTLENDGSIITAELK